MDQQVGRKENEIQQFKKNKLKKNLNHKYFFLLVELYSSQIDDHTPINNLSDQLKNRILTALRFYLNHIETWY
jgi:hypothetical protein